GFAARDGRRLGTIVLDTTVEEGPRAWQQSAALLESGFATKPGASVGDLSIPAAGDGADDLGPEDMEDMEDEILDATGDEGDRAGDEPTTRDIAIVGGIVGVLLIAVGAWALRSRRSRRR